MASRKSFFNYSATFFLLCTTSYYGAHAQVGDHFFGPQLNGGVSGRAMLLSNTSGLFSGQVNTRDLADINGWFDIRAGLRHIYAVTDIWGITTDLLLNVHKRTPCIGNQGEGNSYFLGNFFGSSLAVKASYAIFDTDSSYYHLRFGPYFAWSFLASATGVNLQKRIAVSQHAEVLDGEHKVSPIDYGVVIQGVFGFKNIGLEAACAVYLTKNNIMAAVAGDKIREKTPRPGEELIKIWNDALAACASPFVLFSISYDLMQHFR